MPKTPESEDGKIEELLKKLSETIVFTDRSDPRSLADLHTLLMQVEDVAEDLTESKAAAAAHLAADIVEQVLLEDIDAEKGMDLVGKVASGLQMMFIDGRTFDESHFPAELDVESAEAKIVEASEEPPGEEGEITALLETLLTMTTSTDAGDPRALADLHTIITGVGEAAEDLSDDKAAAAARAAADIVENILLEEFEPAKGISVVRKTCNSLISMFSDGRTFAEANFPPELNLAFDDIQLPTPTEEVPELDDEEIDAAVHLKTLAKAIKLLDISDPRSLADLHTEFTKAADIADEMTELRCATAARNAADLVEKILLDEVNDTGHAVNLLSDTVKSLTNVLVEGKTIAEAGFPPEIVSGIVEEKTEDKPGLAAKIPRNVDEAIFKDFLQSQTASLRELEELILALEGQDDVEKLAQLKRLIHTLKGDSGLMGLMEIGRLCHAIEDALAERGVRAIIDELFAAKDWLARTINAYMGKSMLPGSVDSIINMLSTGSADLVAAKAENEIPAEDEEGKETSLAGLDEELLTDFISESNEHLDNADLNVLKLEGNPEDEEAVNAVFRAFHTIKGVSGFLDLDQIQSLAHEAESLLDKSRKKELVLQGVVIDTIFDAIDAMKRLVANVSRALETGKPLPFDGSISPLIKNLKAVSEGKPIATEPELIAPKGMKLGQILVETGTITPNDVVDGLIAQKQDKPPKKLGEVLVREKRASGKDIVRALRGQKAPATGKAVVIKEALKVDADRLDRLVDLIGELVIAESMVGQSDEIRKIASESLERHMGQLNKITRQLQEMGTSLRMVPIRPTFQKMARLVRDLSKKAGKVVNFNTVGEDTELDKSVIDRIGDPLVHMVRNAIDHGIEHDHNERITAGKPSAGNVELRAFHKGGSIFIEIEDDGRGLDKDAIVAKAVERRLVNDGDQLSDNEIFNLIFEPGFSTAKKITDVSGRGVGMDVVRKNIDAIRGQVVVSSEPGKGSVFSIRLPLTLAIIDGMVVRVGRERYIMPTLSILQSVRPDKHDISGVLERGSVMNFQGELIPIVHLAGLYRIPNAESDIVKATTIVVENDNKRIGIVVDDILGQQQIVIKSLGEYMSGIPGIAGGAIMPDGRVGLILDIDGLIKLSATDRSADQQEMVDEKSIPSS
ncbi:Hpt domain-containing protein [bacterium]|nr:Hpt domain-containing protein [bacterium]